MWADLSLLRHHLMSLAFHRELPNDAYPMCTLVSLQSTSSLSKRSMYKTEHRRLDGQGGLEAGWFTLAELLSLDFYVERGMKTECGRGSGSWIP